MSALLSAISGFFGSDPALRTGQLMILAVAVLLLFLLFYTLRDVFLRVRSFWLQALFLLLVALLPIVGFLLYILLRPSRTLKERQMEKMLTDLHAALPVLPEPIPAADSRPAEPPLSQTL